jgi:tetratricopeptide (TPR) repeat protein
MSLHLLIHRAVVVLSFATLAACPLAARAQGAESGAETDVEQARKHFGQGLKLYKDGDFDAALVQFERAYAVKPNFKVLYNIAQCYFELHQYVEARDTLTRYLKDGEGAIEPERKSAVESDLNELQRRIARVRLSVNAAGASVYVDGKKVGVTPLAAAIDVNEGQRTISVETIDRGSKQRVVRVAGGEEQAVDLDFEASATVPPVAGTSPKTPRRSPVESHGLGAGFWVTGIGALAFGAGAGITGYVALGAQSDHDKALKRFGVSESELADSRNKAKAFALATDILAGSAIVCASIATVLLVTHDSGSEQVAVSLGPSNVTLRGSF